MEKENIRRLKRIKRRLGSRRTFSNTKLISFPCLISCFSSSSDQVSAEEAIDQGVPVLQNVHAFTFNELEAATNGFCSSNKVGEGGFGSVYKGRLPDGTTVAVKVLSAKSKQADRQFMSEIASLSNLSHENLVKLHGGCIDGPRRIIVYDYIGKDNLAQFLFGGKKDTAKFSWRERREIALGIARGLAYIHEEIKPHIVHRDIKARNILLDQNFTPKVSDFGLSKLFSDNITHVSTRVAGTLGYLAPEYAVSGHLTRKSDVYSFGVLLLEIVSGRTAVDFDLELGEHYLVQKAWEMYKADKLVELVDPMLKVNGDYTEIEYLQFLKVALLCVQEKCGVRPYMSTAIRMMRGEIDINGMEIAQPAHISNIFNVKIGQRQEQHHSSRSPTSVISMCSPWRNHS